MRSYAAEGIDHLQVWIAPKCLVALFASGWVRRYAEEKNPGISFKPMG